MTDEEKDLDQLKGLKLVEEFAELMRNKLQKARDEGRTGWWDEKQCSDGWLAYLFLEAVRQCHWVDVMNYTMMMRLRGIATFPTASTRADAAQANGRGLFESQER